jgi:thiol:disulfide interchange protein DsbA
MLRRRLLALALLATCMPAMAQLRWREGVHYTVIAMPERAGAPADRIEVAEVFSYGCTFCFRAKDDVAKLAKSLPADAAMTYVHAAFRPDEGWPVFQRAYYTARKLGIADATHDAMFDAIWKTGELPLVDKATGQLRKPLPSIEEIAKVYARLGPVKVAEFLKVAASPEINAEMARADRLIRQWKVGGTPTLVVNGRYLVSNEAPYAEQAQVVQFLVAQERARLRK